MTVPSGDDVVASPLNFSVVGLPPASSALTCDSGYFPSNNIPFNSTAPGTCTLTVGDNGQAQARDFVTNAAGGGGLGPLSTADDGRTFVFTYSPEGLAPAADSVSVTLAHSGTPVSGSPFVFYRCARVWGGWGRGGGTPRGTRASTAGKEEGRSKAGEATRTGNQNGGDGRACAWEAATTKGMAWPASPVATGCQGNPCSTGIRWGCVSRSPDGLFAQQELEPTRGRPAVRVKRTYGGQTGQHVEEQGTWASRTRKHREAGYGRPVDRGAWTAKTVKRPRQQLAQPPMRQLLGAAGVQTAHHSTSSTAPGHQPLGSANAETTPARAPAAAADRKQRPGATCEGKSG